MAEISVSRVSADTFHVEITEGTSVTHHEVTARADDVSRLAGEEDPELLVQASFEFLLEREPKESILRSFDLPVIERYFSDYPTVIKERLSGGR